MTSSPPMLRASRAAPRNARKACQRAFLTARSEAKLQVWPAAARPSCQRGSEERPGDALSVIGVAFLVRHCWAASWAFGRSVRVRSCSTRVCGQGRRCRARRVRAARRVPRGWRQEGSRRRRVGVLVELVAGGRSDFSRARGAQAADAQRQGQPAFSPSAAPSASPSLRPLTRSTLAPACPPTWSVPCCCIPSGCWGAESCLFPPACSRPNCATRPTRSSSSVRPPPLLLARPHRLPQADLPPLDRPAVHARYNGTGPSRCSPPGWLVFAGWRLAQGLTRRRASFLARAVDLQDTPTSRSSASLSLPPPALLLLQLKLTHVSACSSRPPLSEWLTHQHRDTSAAIIGHPPLLSYCALAEGESLGRMRFELLEVRLRFWLEPGSSKESYGAGREGGAVPRSQAELPSHAPACPSAPLPSRRPLERASF